MSQKIISLFLLALAVLNIGCVHTKNENSAFICKKTQHGIINSQKESDLMGKAKAEVSKLLGTSVLKSSSNDYCEYYISSSSEHFYFQNPSLVESTIYKICFDKSSKVKSAQIEKKQNKSINKSKFKKSLKNQESLSKGDIFKQIFESSDFKMK
jgi:outer membrane protein assembly factor BamE (lipoprotein component of BamABCDE complex)